MKTVTVTVDLDLEEAQYDILWSLFTCNEKEGLDTKLAPYVSAAAHEYLDMFTGSGPITNAVEVRERRLLSIILHGTKDVPPAATIARLFKLTPAAASNLIRNVYAKHDVKLASTVNAQLYAIVDGAEAEEAGGKHFAVIHDAGLVKLLNTLLAEATDTQTLVMPVPGTANEYAMDPGSRAHLLTVLAPPKGA